MNNLTPMLATQNLKESMDWYRSVGFQVVRTNQEWQPDIPVNWCLLELEGNRLMLNSHPNKTTRHVTLNLDVMDAQSHYDLLKEKVEIALALERRFYGRLDFEVTDPNDNALLIGQSV